MTPEIIEWLVNDAKSRAKTAYFFSYTDGAKRWAGILVSFVKWWEKNTVDAGNGKYYLVGEYKSKAREIEQLLLEYLKT